MKHISVKVPEKMHQDLEAVAETNYLKMSDIVRKCLKMGLKSFSIQPQDKQQPQQDKFLHIKGAHHSIFAYCVIDEYIKNKGVEGANMQFQANERARKIIAEIYQGSTKKERV